MNNRSIRQQANCLRASFAENAPRVLSQDEAAAARELAWSLCRLLAIPGHAEAAALNYKRTLALIEAREA